MIKNITKEYERQIERLEALLISEKENRKKLISERWGFLAIRTSCIEIKRLTDFRETCIQGLDYFNSI